MSTRVKFIYVLFPGSSIYNFNEHEMWEEGKTKDAEVQTEDPQESTTHHTPQDLVETADSGLTAQVKDNSPSALVDPGESEVIGLFVYRIEYAFHVSTCVIFFLVFNIPLLRCQRKR